MAAPGWDGADIIEKLIVSNCLLRTSVELDSSLFLWFGEFDIGNVKSVVSYNFSQGSIQQTDCMFFYRLKTTKHEETLY